MRHLTNDILTRVNTRGHLRNKEINNDSAQDKLQFQVEVNTPNHSQTNLSVKDEINNFEINFELSFCI